MRAMDPIFLIHNASRRFCIDGIAKWSERYKELCSTGGNQISKSDGSWTYTDEAYGIFPRYQVLKAILAEIEGFTPLDFKSVSEVRTMLATAADTAQDDFTQFDNEIAVAAVKGERGCVRTFILEIDPDQCAKIPALPFRRVLTEQDHKDLHSAFRAKWGTWYGGCADAQFLSETVTLHDAAMDDPNAYKNLHDAIHDQGINRVFELREWGSGYELDLELAGFTYTGAEGFWTSKDLNWMVYASHESSITFGGTWLVERMRSALPSFDRYIYKGWDLSAYAASEANP